MRNTGALRGEWSRLRLRGFVEVFPEAAFLFDAGFVLGKGEMGVWLLGMDVEGEKAEEVPDVDEGECGFIHANGGVDEDDCESIHADGGFRRSAEAKEARSKFLACETQQ